MLKEIDDQCEMDTMTAQVKVIFIKGCSALDLQL